MANPKAADGLDCCPPPDRPAQPMGAWNGSLLWISLVWAGLMLPTVWATNQLTDELKGVRLALADAQTLTAQLLHNETLSVALIDHLDASLAHQQHALDETQAALHAFQENWTDYLHWRDPQALTLFKLQAQLQQIETVIAQRQ